MRLTGWTVAGLLLAMLIGVMDAVCRGQLALDRRGAARLFPRGWFE